MSISWCNHYCEILGDLLWTSLFIAKKTLSFDFLNKYQHNPQFKAKNQKLAIKVFINLPKSHKSY